MDDEKKDACRRQGSNHPAGQSGHPSRVVSPSGTIVRPLKRAAASLSSGRVFLVVVVDVVVADCIFQLAVAGTAGAAATARRRTNDGGPGSRGPRRPRSLYARFHFAAGLRQSSTASVARRAGGLRRDAKRNVMERRCGRLGRTVRKTWPVAL